MNFILFNGPPRSGKDTAAKIAFDYIQANKNNWPVWEKFSFPNKKSFAGCLNLSMDVQGNVEYYEAQKDTATTPFGVTYRQFQIDISEKFLKPVYGQNIFGKLLLARCEYVDPNINPVFVVSDCGFQIECDVLKDHNVLLIRMRRDGCTFVGDSREYVAERDNWDRHDFYNNGSIEQLKGLVETTVEAWLKK